MIWSFITTSIICFVIIDPIGNIPIFWLGPAHKMRTALEGTIVTTVIMIFFAVCGAWILDCLNISKVAFKITCGIILFVKALNMLAAKRQSLNASKALAMVPRMRLTAIILPIHCWLADPFAIMSVIVVNWGFVTSFVGVMIDCTALIALGIATGIILCMTVVAERWLNDKIAIIFPETTSMILAGLSVWCTLNGTSVIGLTAPWRLTIGN